jgi:predicted phosphoribosyltransferase
MGNGTSPVFDDEKPFDNREEAGMRLAAEIKHKKIKADFVIALPRGGVPVGNMIAKELNIPLRLCFVRKIGHPANEEYAIGAVSEYDEIISEKEQVSEKYLQEKISTAQLRIKEMKKKFGHEYKETELKNKVVILVDDGVATGSCLKLAAKEMRSYAVKQIIIATPVCPSNTVQAMREISDHFICIVQPIHFIGIGGYYNDFKQLSDNEVAAMLS